MAQKSDTNILACLKMYVVVAFNIGRGAAWKPVWETFCVNLPFILFDHLVDLIK